MNSPIVMLLVLSLVYCVCCTLVFLHDREYTDQSKAEQDAAVYKLLYESEQSLNRSLQKSLDATWSLVPEPTEVPPEVAESEWFRDESGERISAKLRDIPADVIWNATIDPKEEQEND